MTVWWVGQNSSHSNLAQTSSKTFWLTYQPLLLDKSPILVGGPDPRLPRRHLDASKIPIILGDFRAAIDLGAPSL